MPDTDSSSSRVVKVWDLPTRVFHWLMALVAIIAIASQEANGTGLWIHVYSGTLLIGFVVFRLVWGVIGSRHARFNDFVHKPSTVKDYTKRLFTFSPPYSVGHNPLGGWVVVLLLVLAFFAAFTGLMVSDDGYNGPLSHIAGGAFGEAHEGFGSALMSLVIIHVIGVGGHWLISGENLPRAMINGVKRVPAYMEAKDIRPVGIIRPIFATALGIAAVWYLF